MRTVLFALLAALVTLSGINGQEPKPKALPPFLPDPGEQTDDLRRFPDDTQTKCVTDGKPEYLPDISPNGKNDPQPDITVLRDVETTTVTLPPKFDLMILGDVAYARTMELADKSVMILLHPKPVTVAQNSDKDRTVRIKIEKDRIEISVPQGATYAFKHRRK
jgi:hypothetical protein